MHKRTALCDYNTEDRSFLFLLMSPDGFKGYHFSSEQHQKFSHRARHAGSRSQNPVGFQACPVPRDTIRTGSARRRLLPRPAIQPIDEGCTGDIIIDHTFFYFLSRYSHSQPAAVFCFPLQARVMEDAETPQICAASRTPENDSPVVQLRTALRRWPSRICCFVSSLFGIPFCASRILSPVDCGCFQPCSLKAPCPRL